VFYQR